MNFPLHSAFVAIPLVGEAKSQFQAYREALKPFEEFLRLQKPDTPHLTLNFWRSMMEIEYLQVLNEAENVARQSEVFDLPVNAVDTFSYRGIHSILFLKPVFSPELAVLKKRCPWANPPTGLPSLDPAFRPHLTIARISHPQKFIVHQKKVMKALEGVDLTMRVDRIALYASVNGVNQTPLKEWVFGV